MNKLIIGLVLLLFVGCSPSITKQRYRAYSFYQENPKELAELCAKEFPIKEVYIPGDTVFTPGPVIELPGDTIECPDGSKVVTPPKKAQCPPNSHRVDTVVKENTALVATLQLHQQELSNKLYAAEIEIKRLQKQSRTRFWIIIGFSAFLGLGIFLKLKPF